jgi:flagellar motor switch protein FliM
MSNAASQDVVSQSEIEKLLAQVGSGEVMAAESGPTVDNPDFARKYEFPKASLFSAAELRRVRFRCEQFIVGVGARLSVALGLEMSVQMSKLDTTTFDKFIDSVTNPSHLVILNLEPLPGACVLDIPLRLGLSMVDRELGGAGAWTEEPRELTKMETGLLSKIVDVILGEWSSVWREFCEIRGSQVGVENNSRFLDVCPPDTNLLVVAIEIRFGQIAETIQFAMPYSALEPLLAQLNTVEAGGKKPAGRAFTQPRWAAFYDDVQVNVTAEFPNVTLKAGQLADLKIGDLIPLPGEMFQQVRLLFEGAPKFVGVLGTRQDHWAVEIVSVSRKPSA